MQPRNNNNRMMQRNNKNRHGGRHNNQNRGGGGGGNQGQNRNRINISHVTNQRDKFTNQARDAMHSGDRVLSEYYLQHADHYQRLINEYNEEQEARRAQFQDQPAPAPQEDPAPAEPFMGEAAAPAALPLPPAIPLDRDDLEPKEV